MLKRIDKPEKILCQYRGHKPGMHHYLDPGEYEWTCDMCGEVTLFTVQSVSYKRLKFIESDRKNYFDLPLVPY